MMMIKLKQAIGRTNRHDNQDSLVLVLDPRIHTKRYGQQILTFFEKDYQVLQPSERDMVAIAQEFFE